jgi:hypothetical protein
MSCSPPQRRTQRDTPPQIGLALLRSVSRAALQAPAAQRHVSRAHLGHLHRQHVAVCALEVDGADCGARTPQILRRRYLVLAQVVCGGGGHAQRRACTAARRAAAALRSGAAGERRPQGERHARGARRRRRRASARKAAQETQLCACAGAHAVRSGRRSQKCTGAKSSEPRPAMEARLAAAEAALATAQRERQAERTGRIRAEKALREARAAVRPPQLSQTRLSRCAADPPATARAGGGCRRGVRGARSA